MSLKKEVFGTAKRRSSVRSPAASATSQRSSATRQQTLGSHQRTVRHDPRRSWQFGLNQFGRPRSPDRASLK
jgi:hypothetical protein